jgi:hypothetical protein
MFQEDEDADAWQRYPQLRWIYDRLQLCERLGYQCGPAGVAPPIDGQWFIKPQINLCGMGLGAQLYIGQPIPAGYFWMPCFEGQQLSVDLQLSKHSLYTVREVLTVAYEHGRPRWWTRLPAAPEYLDRVIPTWLLIELRMAGVDKFNIEFVGGKIIEMHLRWGHDFDAAPHDAKYAKVIWADDNDQQSYTKDYEDCLGALPVARLGFRYY